jgi:hypothetical protein
MKTSPDPIICPRCHSARLKGWPELTADEKLIFELVLKNSEYPPAQRKKHRYCVRCMHQEPNDSPIIA